MKIQYFRTLPPKGLYEREVTLWLYDSISYLEGIWNSFVLSTFFATKCKEYFVKETSHCQLLDMRLSCRQLV